MDVCSGRLLLAFTAFAGASLPAAEITIQNDSVTDFTTAVIVTGFVANERAAAWLTTSCAGNIVAAQVFWRSEAGGTAAQFADRIEIFRGASFPSPGSLAQEIVGPLLNDGVINEFRFLDENMTIPVMVPVAQNETFVISLDFAQAPPAPNGPSIVRDTDGCQAGRNTIFAIPPSQWFSSCDLGLTGDWVIRAVVDCQAGGLSADLSATVNSNPVRYTAGQPLQFTIDLSNAGPSTVLGASVLDAFPAALSNVIWACSAGVGASCNAASGNGDINTSVNLGPSSTVTIIADGTVAPGTTGAIVNNVTIAPPVGVTELNPANNIASISVQPEGIFEDGFEQPPP